jgi:hypothetical protein
MRARGREAYTVGAGGLAGDLSGAGLGITLAALAVGLVASYYVESEAIARGIRRSGVFTVQRGPGLAALVRVKRTNWLGQDMYTLMEPSGRVARAFPATPEGHAKALRTARYINEQETAVPAADRRRQKSHPQQSAGGLPSGWRRKGRVTGMQG